MKTKVHIIQEDNEMYKKDNGNKWESNHVKLQGEVVSGFTFAYDVFGEKFYSFDLSVSRLSGFNDTIPVVVSERLMDVNEDWIGQFIKIDGQFRSYNAHGEDGKSRLLLNAFAREVELADEQATSDSDLNKIYLNGYVCKEPVYRKTPLGREIADILVAVNRSYGKSDYIPCICWGRNARYASTFEVGTNVEIEGRIQSRSYSKKVSDTEVETRTAYEVSVSMIGANENV